MKLCFPPQGKQKKGGARKKKVIHNNQSVFIISTALATSTQQKQTLLQLTATTHYKRKINPQSVEIEQIYYGFPFDHRFHLPLELDLGRQVDQELVPFVASEHSLMPNDCDHLSEVGPLGAMEGGSICMVVSHDYTDPEKFKEKKKLLSNYSS